jgi:uncharacterized protein YaiE (UPF0345 family)
MTIALAEYTICKVASVSGVDLKTAGKTVLYTVPVGKTFYPVAVVIREPSASLAGGTEYDFGTGANADTWVQNVDLSAMTTLSTDFKVIDSGGTKYSKCAASSEFGIKVITGSTLAAVAVIDVFGFLA